MRKNYILRTALSWLVLLCGLLPAWGQNYKLVTSLDEIKDDGKYVIVCPTKKVVMGAQNGSYRASVNVVITNDEIMGLPDGAAICTIKQDGSNHTIYTGAGYLYWDSNNSVKTSTSAYSWTIRINNGVTTIVSTDTPTRKLQYNAGSPRFACYTSSQTAIALYKLDESVSALTEATISFDGISETLEKDLTVGSYSSVATTNSTATISYSSSKPEVAEIDATGKVTLKAGGETTITASVAQNEAYTAAEVSYTLTVIDNSDPQLAFENEAIVAGGEYTMDISDGSFYSKAISKVGSTGAITYSGNKDEVATIDATTGLVTLKSVGEVTITATIAEATPYKAETIAYTLKVTDTTIRETVIFNSGNSSWSKVSGSSYEECTGNQILVGSDGREYVWNFTQTLVTGGNLQMKKTSGKLVSPTIRTQYGFDFIITASNNAAKISASSGAEASVEGIGTVTLRVESTESVVTLGVVSGYVRISEIKIVPIDPTQKETPTITIEGVDEDGLLSMLYKEDGEYTIVATTTNTDEDAVITYSTTDTAEEVILLDEETGYMLFVAPGTTTITASVNETANFKATTTSFSLELVDPADIKTFVKVTDGRIGTGKYLLVGMDAGDIPVAMSTVLNSGENRFMQSPITIETDGKVYTDDATIVWDIKKESDGNWSISNGGTIYVGYTKTNTSDNNYAYAVDSYNSQSAWEITGDSDVASFSIHNVFNTSRYLRYNNGSDWFACYTKTPTSSIQSPMLYRLETHCVPEGGEQAYTGSYVKTFSMVSQLWSNGKFVLKLHPAEIHHVYFNYTAPFYGTSFPLLKGEENVAISTDCHIAEGGVINPGYLYIDWNDDGVFDPVTELVAQGESADAMPTFNVNAPDATTVGLHRARFEVDTDNTTPCELNDLENNIAKGSVVVDFDINYFYEVPQEPDPNNPTDIEEVEENVELYYSNGNIYTNVEGEVAIYDLSGKLVRRAHVAPVAVDDLAGGVYIVRVGDKVVKFVK